MNLYKDMSFEKQIKSYWVFQLPIQAKNFVFIMVKTTINHYEDYPVMMERFMDFEVIEPLKSLLGRKITVSLDINQDIKITKIV